MSEEVKWTKEQKQAIEEKGENRLVAAAAGSRKMCIRDSIMSSYCRC